MAEALPVSSRHEWPVYSVTSRSIRGAVQDRCGSGCDRQLFGFIAGKPTLKVRCP